MRACARAEAAGIRWAAVPGLPDLAGDIDLPLSGPA